MSGKPPNYTKMSDKEYYEYLKQQNQGKPLYDPTIALDKDTMGDAAYYKAVKEMYREDWAKNNPGKDFDSWETDNPDRDSKRVIERNKGNAGPRSKQPSLPPKDQLNVISQLFLNRAEAKYSKFEMEAKFGTRGIKPITKLDYDNVVKKLKSIGFISANEVGTYSLKIQPEFIDVRTGDIKTTSDFDRFRIEIEGLTSIQEYCKTNDLKLINDKHSSSVTIMRKTDVKPDSSSNNTVSSANFDDFNFRVSLKNEETISKVGKIGLEIFSNWDRSKKVFRYINRVTFIHRDNSIPFQFDLSIVRNSNKNERGWLIPTSTIDESNVFDNPELYEIEIEVLPVAKVSYKTPQDLSSNLQKMVKNVLSGLQRTNYPISYPEQKDVIQGYLKLLFEESARKKGENFVPKDRVYPSDFIGPSLKTLEVQNVGPLNPDMIIPNITEPYAYCVTEKADGDRHLMFVNSIGKIYLINMNMNVIFTGAKTEEEKCFNSLLDGELILHNKKDQFINTFAAFDIYYINNIDVRARPFVKTISKDEKYFAEGCRLPMLKDFMKLLKPISIIAKQVEQKSKALMLLSKFKGENKSPMSFISKNFYPMFDGVQKDVPHALGKYNIFEANNYLLRRIADNLFDYEIDGLIFTPTLLGVGSNKFLEAGPKKKVTWTQCFKWKPSEATSIFPKSYNTIDFLVFTKKDATNSDIITPIFENGINVYESTQFNQYKTLILAVGFDQSKHGYINPCQDVLDDKYATKDADDESGYKPKQFYPSNPYDPLAGLCNIMLELDTNGTYQMFTEERDVFEDQMVVEFRYDMTKPGLWKWVPMRVRYDKTADFRAKQGVGANDYNTANYNWTSIHNPVTEKMIATGEGIPSIEVSDDVYYNSVTTDKMTQGMRDFHNLFVKKALIQGVSRRGNNLIDFACGKAGDLPKWIAANLSFVFGIDISKDNLENKLNGACARFLNFKKTTKVMPYALFVNGNSALNIRSGTNMFSDKANEITKTVFGSIGETKTFGPAVERQHAVGVNGFDISSCQFAIHYMFENKRTFYNFIRNVAECTKLNGHFIATCYDGRTIFNMLKKKELGESRDIYIDDKKVWSVTKDYDESIFEDNESCLGYKISVYQDSINQTIPEYLVNFDFLTQTMDKYGFALVSREEAKAMQLPEGSGMFSELYNSMMLEIKRDPKKQSDYKDAVNMKQYEKDISFLNRFFVYKKVSTRNAEKLTKALIEQLPDEEEFEQSGTMLAREAVQEAEEAIKPKAKKLGKILIQDEPELKVAPKKSRKAKVVEIAEEEAPVVVPEEVIEIPSKPKKTTRKKKLADFEIVEEGEIVEK